MAGVSQPSGLVGARERAAALVRARDLAGARAVLEHAVEVGKGMLGEDDPAVLGTLHQLARVHQEADDPMGARRVLEEAYAAGQWRLGDADPLMLEISYDLGIVAEELGNRHEARKAFGRVASVGAEVLGPAHWAVARARAYLGDERGLTGGPLKVRSEPVRSNPPVVPVPRTPVAGLEEATAVQPAVRTGAAFGPPAEMPTEIIYDAPTPAPPLPAPPPTPPPQPMPAAPQPVALSRTYRKRGAAVYAAVAASLAAVIAVIALVLVLANRQGDEDRGTTSNVPTLGGPAPTDVQLAADRSTITVTWADPSDGKTTFVVEMARPGEVMKAVGHVGPGQTSYRMEGLNDRLDYCFTVVAVYGTNTFSPSPQTCTTR